MTPDEVNRTIEFIVQSQARLAAAQEQDREDRIQFEKRYEELNKRLATVSETQILLLEHQSQRLDWAERQQEAAERAAQRRHEEFRDSLAQLQKEALIRLDRILQILIERSN